MTDGLELLKKLAVGLWKLVVWVVLGTFAIILAFAGLCLFVAR